MKRLTATLCLTIAVLLGSAWVGESAERFHYENSDGTQSRVYQMTDDFTCSITPELAKVMEYLDDGNIRSALKKLRTHETNILSKSHYEALHNLGVIYYQGIGTQKNYSLAYNYFKRAEEALHQYHSSSVMKTRLVQSTLKILGFYSGKVDGDWGPNTSKAFQHAVEKHKLDEQAEGEEEQSIMLVRLIDHTRNGEGVRNQYTRKVVPTGTVTKHPTRSKTAIEKKIT